MNADAASLSVPAVAGGVTLVVALVALAGGVAFPEARSAWGAGCGIAAVAGWVGLWPLARRRERAAERAVNVLTATAVRFGVVVVGLILAVVFWSGVAKWVVGGAGAAYLALLLVETIWTMRRK